MNAVAITVLNIRTKIESIAKIEFEKDAVCELKVEFHKCGYSFSGGDIFDCLCSFRKEVEQEGNRLLCNGARLDAYPSGMARQMAYGMLLYRFENGSKSEIQKLKIFDPAAIENVTTVDQQLKNYQAWLVSIGVTEK